jgi:putative oxygen-independent coproporphyrinogen III oxidase
MADFGVYVHIPFCSRRCDYCAFATWTDRGHLVDDYVAAVVTDIERKVASGMERADTVFFGGGTPTLIDPAHVARIVAAIPRADGAEVTVECNPDNVTAELMETSMVSHVLGSLGREHDQENVARAVAHARAAGIMRVNLDLIYGAAGESLDDWRVTLLAALEMSPTHVSAYGLTVEPGTPLAEDPSRHPDDDEQADKYIVADQLLTVAGLANYEISNWALPGEECRHNRVYWDQGNYEGFGCAAHSHRDGRRWWNVRTPDRYVELVNAGGSVVAADEVLDETTRRFEKLELSLRTSRGVPAGALDLDAEELSGLVEVRDGNAVLTRAGRLLANEISTRLLS